jgi:hypothetical protein
MTDPTLAERLATVRRFLKVRTLVFDRPHIDSPERDVFTAALDMGCVEDLGGGYAKRTPIGSYLLKHGRLEC